MYQPKSVFPQFSLDREKIRWEKYLDVLTPWENHGGIWFKMEQEFAPLGYGGPNGSKMRQLIWYVSRYRGGKTHIVTGASVQSPQLSMSAIVGAHYRLPSRQVVYSKPGTVLGHPNPRIAAGFGAEFEYARGPYNPIIQARVAQLRQPDSLLVHYGISVPHDGTYPPEEVQAFHEVGALQTRNLPREVERLIVPAGSCNTLMSVLLGLSRDPGNLRELYTIGIGPDKRGWLRERARYAGLDAASLPFRWRHHSLHDSGYSTYSEKFRGESHEGITFHPTYEAKIWRWLRTYAPVDPDGRTGFWIVGSEADPRVVEPFMQRNPG